MTLRRRVSASQSSYVRISQKKVWFLFPGTKFSKYMYFRGEIRSPSYGIYILNKCSTLTLTHTSDRSVALKRLNIN